MQKIAIIVAMLIIALFSISCATSTQTGHGAKSPASSELRMPPAWGGQYGGR